MFDLHSKLAFAFWLFSSFVRGQVQNPCDPDLKAPPNKQETGYRLRGDRCEGEYVSKVSGSDTLAIASFVETVTAFDAQKLPVLRLDLDSPTTDALRIRV